jgi:nicotinate-nucleotide--dimethylbenzimidazole phosphoribosyltransferase
MVEPPFAELLIPECADRFTEEARKAVYEVIALRRDVRDFREDLDVDDATLHRILGAAHLAPSVGFSQPWGFVVVRDGALRARIRESFLLCREAEAARYPPARRAHYLSFRLEGIVQAPLNVCVAVDLRSRGEAILGTTAQPEAVRASVCCAVQNLWLAARAEGVGVGWVSIVEPAVLRSQLHLPPGVEPIAYLCIGIPRAFRARPMLEETGWLPRRPLRDALHSDLWLDPEAEATREPSARDHSQGNDLTAAAAATAAPDPDPDPEKTNGLFDARAWAAARAHQRELTKPPGSLGRLEELAAWYAGAVGRFPCEPPRQATVAVFAADHGVVVEGVSAYGSQVTAAMVCTMMAGGAAINVLARRYGVEIALVDVGVSGDLSAAPANPEVPLWREKVRAGTGNLRREAAMTREQVEAALQVGARTATRCIEAGARIVAVGEVGIGNTTAAAALVCALTGAAPQEVVGTGTGLDAQALARKAEVVDAAVARSGFDPARAAADPVGVLAALGGLELAAMAGFAQRSAELRVPVVLDGFLAGAAGLVARALRPAAVGLFVASHLSSERGHALALRALGLRPLLSLDLRLGEGTGAVLGIDLIRSAVALQSEMATFATAGVRR